MAELEPLSQNELRRLHVKFPQNRLRIGWYFHAPPHDLFAAWTTPGLLKRWFCPEEMRVISLDSDPVPGGEYSVTMKGHGRSYTAYGNYLELKPPYFLAFTWEWESDPVATYVTVEFYPEGRGTELVLQQLGFVNEAEAREHREGWESALKNLQRLFP